MKTRLISFFFLCIINLTSNNCFCQVTNSTNTATSNVEYCGWDGTGANTKDLDIKNLFANKKY